MVALLLLAVKQIHDPSRVRRRATIRATAVALIFFFADVFGQAASAEKSGTAPVASPTSLGGQDAFREIAAMAVSRSGDQLGRSGGFYLNPKFHIPLPGSMDRQVRALDRSYASILHVEVEKTLNRAAEQTMVPADDFVMKALASETFADSQQILRRPQDNIANQLKARIEPSFRQAMRPLVQANLGKVGAPAALERMRARYEQITKTAFPEVDLTEYTLDHFVAVFFSNLAEQEQTIRLRPSKSLNR